MKGVFDSPVLGYTWTSFPHLKYCPFGNSGSCSTIIQVAPRKRKRKSQPPYCLNLLACKSMRSGSIRLLSQFCRKLADQCPLPCLCPGVGRSVTHIILACLPLPWATSSCGLPLCPSILSDLFVPWLNVKNAQKAFYNKDSSGPKCQ